MVSLARCVSCALRRDRSPHRIEQATWRARWPKCPPVFKKRTGTRRARSQTGGYNCTEPRTLCTLARVRMTRDGPNSRLQLDCRCVAVVLPCSCHVLVHNHAA